MAGGGRPISESGPTNHPAARAEGVRVRDRRGESPHGVETTALRILVVEDTPEFRTLIVEPLQGQGFEVGTAEDGERAVALARSLRPDVIVLDLGLPKMDGVEACRQIRAFSDAWIIMLTSRNEEVDKVVGLSVGADYMTKPFSSRELVARIRAVQRRRHQPSEVGAMRRVGDVVIDSAAREVTLGGQKVELTRLEFDLLALLAANPRVVFSRDRLLDRLWGPGWRADHHVVDVHVSNLRQKLGDDPQKPRYIKTVRGVGFRLGPG